MIELIKVNKWFNKHKKNKIHVINDTSLKLPNTGLVSLLGPSGSGKTTLLNAIGGLDKINKGKIFINGKKISSNYSYKVDKIRNLSIGSIFQDYKLINDLSVYENVSLVLKIIGIKDKKEIDKRVLYVLDKVGMLRYKNRPCNMLSGGEKQRVGIARALVKNPSIVIADEPTGNLDSKNSIEIMNIIKAISKEKLVILVTHEVNLAKFYSDRIIELEDGTVVKDYKNNHNDELDYSIDNRFYLQDFNNKYIFNNDNCRLNVYKENEKLDVDIVIKNNNIYIRSNNKLNVELVDQDSNIEFINGNFKSITKDDIDSYKFDYDKIINKDKKLKYSSIFNPITFILNGFRKVFNYSTIKKILLIGFFISGIFIMYSYSSIFAVLDVKDKDLVTKDKNLNVIKTNKIDLNIYNGLKSDNTIKYIKPSDSTVSFKFKDEDLYQFSKYEVHLSGTLIDISTINESNIIYGNMPSNSFEVVIDKYLFEYFKKTNEISKMLSFNNSSDLLGIELSMDNIPHKYKIVGISNTGNPSIYVDNSMMNILLLNSSDDSVDYYDMSYVSEEDSSDIQLYDVYSDKVVLKEGRIPSNDYEVLINYNLKEDFPLNKYINKKINNNKLLVVGYYTSFDDYNYYFVNNNMIELLLVEKSNNISIYPNNINENINKYKDNFNIYNNYVHEKDSYLKESSKYIRSTIISSIIILCISLIEILFMIRSSFLSRIKEVGIYRAIGVKKSDIYIMFSGEIFAITTLCCVPGILLSSYILSILNTVSFIEGMFKINIYIILLGIITIYLFNFIIGLLPVFNTLRKRPAEILSRIDI